MLEHKGYHVSFCDDVGINKGGLYCEVYTDNWMCYTIDSFVITKEQLKDLDRDEIARRYIDKNIKEYRNNIQIIQIKQ